MEWNWQQLRSTHNARSQNIVVALERRTVPTYQFWKLFLSIFCWSQNYVCYFSHPTKLWISLWISWWTLFIFFPWIHLMYLHLHDFEPNAVWRCLGFAPFISLLWTHIYVFTIAGETWSHSFGAKALALYLTLLFLWHFYWVLRIVCVIVMLVDVFLPGNGLETLLYFSFMRNNSFLCFYLLCVSNLSSDFQASSSHPGFRTLFFELILWPHNWAQYLFIWICLKIKFGYNVLD